ncbi:MAG: electron transport complex protein RnfC, partial [Candidatus Marinimicrobia bacterium]|nr:electron transport complex protein RnfC [Candidatus Neomarinimicrobiota bacterium]
VKKLGLSAWYKKKAVFQDISIDPAMVKISLTQHIGSPALPMVHVGDEVYEGDIIASVREKELGVPVHASIHGMVTEISSAFIRIERI